jgi:hypothetical protein
MGNHPKISKFSVTEMAYLRSVKGYMRLDYFCNEDIRQELRATPITENTDNYRK